MKFMQKKGALAGLGICKMTSLKINNTEFKNFDITAKALMESYLEELSLNISDYTFAANYIWLSGAAGFYAIIEDTFCLFILNGGELSMMLPPIGKRGNLLKAIDKCFELMNANNSSIYYSRIDYVHKDILECFIGTEAEIFETLEGYIVEKKLADYVYATDDLISLTGNSYKSKRNEINHFKKAHESYKIEILNSKKHGTLIIDLFNKWVSDRMHYMPKEEIDPFLDGMYLEKTAIKRLIKDYDKLDLIGVVLYIGNEIKGFSVGERINKDTASVIIEKTDFAVLGCAQFIFREFSKILKEHYGSEYINVGDDMGFENLKKVKMSYRPKFIIPKYSIYQKL